MLESSKNLILSTRKPYLIWTFYQHVKKYHTKDFKIQRSQQAIKVFQCFSEEIITSRDIQQM